MTIIKKQKISPKVISQLLQLAAKELPKYKAKALSFIDYAIKCDNLMMEWQHKYDTLYCDFGFGSVLAAELFTEERFLINSNIYCFKSTQKVDRKIISVTAIINYEPARHCPTNLVIKINKGAIFAQIAYLKRFTLIDFDDCLHVSNISDRNKALKLAQKRYNQIVNSVVSA